MVSLSAVPESEPPAASSPEVLSPPAPEAAAPDAKAAAPDVAAAPPSETPELPPGCLHTLSYFIYSYVPVQHVASCIKTIFLNQKILNNNTNLIIKSSQDVELCVP